MVVSKRWKYVLISEAGSDGVALSVETDGFFFFDAAAISSSSSRDSWSWFKKMTQLYNALGDRCGL